MSIKGLNDKFFSQYGDKDEESLKRKIIKLYEDYSNDPDTMDCWVDCIAIQLDIDNDAYVKGVVAART